MGRTAIVEVSNVFAPIFQFNHPYVLLRSGRLGGKTTIAIQIAVALVSSHNDRDVIITRSDYSALEDSAYNEFIKWVGEYGLEGQYSFYKAPLRIVNNTTGGIIYFKGIGGADKSRTRSIRTVHPVIAVIFEELQQLRDRESLEQAHASFRRLMDDKGMMIHLFNPEPQNGHWLNVFYRLKKNDPDWLCIETSYKDVAKFIGENDLKEIIKMKILDNERYQWMYEGKTGGGYGSVYYEFKRDKHLLNRPIATIKFGKEQVVGVIIGVDTAVTHDCTAYVPCLIMNNGQMVVPGKDIFIHDPLKYGDYGSVELMPHISKWFKGICDFYRVQDNKIPVMFVVDSAGTELIKILRYNLPNWVQVYSFTKPSIIQMVDNVKGVLARNMIYLIDDGYHINVKGSFKTDNILADELENLRWKDKEDGSTPTTYDPSIPNDVCDAFTYAVNTWYSNPNNLYWLAIANKMRKDFYDLEEKQ